MARKAKEKLEITDWKIMGRKHKPVACEPPSIFVASV
jgi:hypothetical protein